MRWAVFQTLLIPRHFRCLGAVCILCPSSLRDVTTCIDDVFADYKCLHVSVAAAALSIVCVCSMMMPSLYRLLTCLGERRDSQYVGKAIQRGASTEVFFHWRKAHDTHLPPATKAQPRLSLESG